MPSHTWEENPTPERIAELIEALSGRGGADCESAVNECAWEVADGYVSAYFGAGSRAARFLKRCGSAVLRLRVDGDDGHAGLHVQVNASAFRGLEFAFRNLDAKGPPMTDEQKARAFGGEKG